ncbi:hypothetical protein VTP01DRAFT_6100 [Rhizomucor pusillus]|uniref:uncharacterized protein n=1 Tax=Rhizomucor pusillus TaxID=4840 RepID=UPI003742FF4B
MNTDKGDKSTDPTSLLQHVAARSKLISDRIQPKGLPHLERGFNTLDSELKKYSSKVSDISDPDADVKAHYFLSKGGVNTPVLMRDLGTIHIGAAADSRQPIQDTDIEGYFAQRRTDTIVDAIMDGKQEAINGAEDDYDQEFQASWNGLRTTLSGGRQTIDNSDQASLNLSKSKVDMSRIVAAGHYQ